MKNSCPKPRLTPEALAARFVIAGTLIFWLGIGFAVCWLCLSGPTQ